MILAALRFLTQHLNVRVLFMTATMPVHLLEAISAAAPDARLIGVGSDIADKPARHRLSVLDIESDSAEAVRLIETAAGNGSVLVVVNLVKRAISLFTLLKDRGFSVRFFTLALTTLTGIASKRKQTPEGPHPGVDTSC